MRPEVSPENMDAYRPSFVGSARTGMLCGLVGAWAVFGMMLAVGGQLGLPPGTFYQMVGVSMGVEQEWPAIYLGFGLHMLTGAVIGLVYMVVSDRVALLRVDFSTPKAFATGIATGIAVWGILFIPLHFFAVQPTLQNLVATSASDSMVNQTAAKLLLMSNEILYGALAIHIAFGGILGFMARIATSARG